MKVARRLKTNRDGFRVMTRTRARHWLRGPIVASGLVICFTSLGCSPKPGSQASESTPVEGEPAIIAQVGGHAASIYRARCATCHGIAGLGNGAAAKPLPVKPRSFKDETWRSRVSDAHLRKVIVQGGAAVGKSALMTANYDLKDKPNVLADLIKIIRGL